MEELNLIPLTNEEVANFSLSDLVALYKTEQTGKINVGRPYLVSYFPVMANMYGFNDAIEKGYYIVVDDDTIVSDRPMYKISVDVYETVKNANIMNEIEYSDLLFKEINKSIKEINKR